ncbi:MAG: amidase [Pseudomonadales bacterium]|nr:amidase [Pseudomonadales bacterium]
MTLDELRWIDATATAELISTGEITSVEAVDAALARMDRLNPELNAVIHEFPEAARADAAAHDRSPGSGPLAGVPFLLKDIGAPLAGQPYHLGTAVLREANYVAPVSSHLGQRFLNAGLVVLGRTNLPEFGLMATTEPVAFGPTRSPWDPSLSPGGSSGGSAAAIAAGIVPAAHGNDGGGSIRIPASLSGLVGLKSSRGRVSNGPSIGEAWSGLAHEGALARSVRDAAVLLDVISGYEPGDHYGAPSFQRPLSAEVGEPPGALRIGFLHALDGYDTHPDCVDGVTTAVKLLGDLGHHIEDASPAALQRTAEVLPLLYRIFAPAVALNIESVEAMVGRPVSLAEFEPRTQDHARRAPSVSAVDHFKTMQSIYEHSRDLQTWWQSFDLLVTPVLAQPKLPLGTLVFDENDPDESHAAMLRFMPYTAQFNMSGQPAISLPLHRTSAGQPVGVQLVAGYGREDVLIRVASQLEAAAPWSDIHPQQIV